MISIFGSFLDLVIMEPPLKSGIQEYLDSLSGLVENTGAARVILPKDILRLKDIRSELDSPDVDSIPQKLISWPSEITFYDFDQLRRGVSNVTIHQYQDEDEVYILCDSEYFEKDCIQVVTFGELNCVLENLAPLSSRVFLNFSTYYYSQQFILRIMASLYRGCCSIVVPYHELIGLPIPFLGVLEKHRVTGEVLIGSPLVLKMHS